MSISGKISVGIRAIVSAPRMTMRNAITTNVYGRLRAMRTSHMDRERNFSCTIELRKEVFARDSAPFGHAERIFGPKRRTEAPKFLTSRVARQLLLGMKNGGKEP